MTSICDECYENEAVQICPECGIDLCEECFGDHVWNCEERDPEWITSEVEDF